MPEQETQARIVGRAWVARRLGLSEARITQLDNVLRPTRSAEGRRLYDRAVVEAVATEREIARVARMAK